MKTQGEPAPAAILHSIPELSTQPGPIFLSIGVFDGVHLGHRAVIERAIRDARAAGGTSVVLTFDPHPLRILQPQHAPRLLTSTPHKLQLIRELGAGAVLVLKFDRDFAATAPEDFIGALHAACKPLREICVGHQWSFGRNRAGNLDLLRRIGDEAGFDEVGVPAVEIDGRIVSSTLIRGAVQAGDFETAHRFLGREYTILGTVVEGDHLGRKIGFPTANLTAHNEQFPPDGVYAVEAIHNGRRHKGVVNIGVRPTVTERGGERILELHLFDFDSNIYGDDIEVFFRRYLRPERKFATLEDLRAQIERDAHEARALL